VSRLDGCWSGKRLPILSERKDNRRSAIGGTSLLGWNRCHPLMIFSDRKHSKIAVVSWLSESLLHCLKHFSTSCKRVMASWSSSLLWENLFRESRLETWCWYTTLLWLYTSTDLRRHHCMVCLLLLSQQCSKVPCHPLPWPDYILSWNLRGTALLR